MALDTIALLVGIIVDVVVNSLFVWLAGRALVGAEKAKFTDAIWIVIIGSVISGILVAFELGLVGALISLILWLALIKHFFDCGWLKAFLITILAVIIQVIIRLILGILLGAAMFTLGFGL